MTDQKPVISDAVVIMPQDVSEFEYNAEEHGTRYALSAFLAARLPRPIDPGVILFLNEDDMMPRKEQPAYKHGFNACLDIILKGRGG